MQFKTTPVVTSAMLAASTLLTAGIAWGSNRPAYYGVPIAPPAPSTTSSGGSRNGGKSSAGDTTVHLVRPGWYGVKTTPPPAPVTPPPAPTTEVHPEHGGDEQEFGDVVPPSDRIDRVFAGGVVAQFCGGQFRVHRNG